MGSEGHRTPQPQHLPAVVAGGFGEGEQTDQPPQLSGFDHRHPCDQAEAEHDQHQGVHQPVSGQASLRGVAADAKGSEIAQGRQALVPLAERGVLELHLLEGLGGRGLTRLFHNLSILAWAVVIAKGLALLAPWEAESPLFKILEENVSHRAADLALEVQELAVRFLP